MSRLINRNIRSLSGRTSMRLEPEFWEAAAEICHRQDMTLSDLMKSIETAGMGEASRTSAMRTFILEYYRHAATAGGHAAAGHGERDKVVA
jgi:predicted DNA-binding ribbon-helix-helix protein